MTNDGKSLYFTDPTFGLQATGDIGFLDSLDRSIQGIRFYSIVIIDSEFLMQ